MRGKIGDNQRLLHILDSIAEIEKYTSGVTIEIFLENSMMRFASIKQIEIIGEAAIYISDETKDKCTGIEWRQIVGMRHILVHEYFGVNNLLIWQIIMGDIPKLKEVVQLVISSGNVE